MADADTEEALPGWPTGKERMRRRAPPIAMGFRSGEGLLAVTGGFSDNQLKQIGAIVLEWNELEERTGLLFSACLDLEREIATQVTKAVVGLDARFSIIRSAIKNVKGIPDDVSRRCFATLAKLSEYKKIRDLLGHCRMWNEHLAIAHSQDNKAKTWEVLVSDDALDIFYRRISALRWEILDICGIFSALSHRIEITTWIAGRLEGALKEQWRQSTIQEHVSRLADHQKTTESIPLLPLFPDAHSMPLRMAEWKRRHPS